MRDWAVFFAFFFIPFATQAVDNHLTYETREERVEDSNKKLREVSRRYLAFIDRMSQGENFPQEEIAETLIAFDCRKILNGKLYTESRDAFIADLLQVNKNQGCWKVHPVDIITSPESRTVVMRLMIDMENVGAFTEILILRFDSNYLITEMNCVFSRIDGSYSFDA